MAGETGWYARARALERIDGVLRQGLDLVSFWNETRSLLAKAVPHHLMPCWFTLDPASLLVTSHYDHGMIPELPHEWLAHEYLEDDFNSLADFARSERRAATLHEATGGDPARSERWKRFISPYGGEQELLIALRARSGGTWGVLALYREPGQPTFSDEEIAFLVKLAPSLAEGAQRALLAGEAIDPEGPEAPGLVVLDEDLAIESATPGTDRWLDELYVDHPRPGGLPHAVQSVAARALRTGRADVPGEVAFARVVTKDGRWVTLHGAALVGDRRNRVAIVIEPAHPARITPLLMEAYGLTERERDITRLVLQGASTGEIATELVISPQTVQQHLKSVFEKTGVRSRRELVGKVFFAHYEPRLRDNERRGLSGRPLRGGPAYDDRKT